MQIFEELLCSSSIVVELKMAESEVIGGRHEEEADSGST